MELQHFLISAFWGMLVVVYYDFFRLLRVMVHHTTLMVAIEDIVFSMGAGCMIFSVAYSYMQGQLRGYLLLGIILGGALYFFGISPFLRGFFACFYNKMKELLKKVKKQSKMKCNDKAKDGKDEQSK